MLGNPNKTGYAPQTAISQKLKAMGISSVDQLQGTTKVIFDTADWPVFPANSLEFFNQNRQLPDTNFLQRFGVGEAMLIQEIEIARLRPTDAQNLGVNTPYEYEGLDQYWDGGLINWTLKLGNTNILEQVPYFGSNTSNNQQINNLGLNELGDVFISTTNLPYKFQANSLIIIPPDTDLSLTINNIDNFRAGKVQVKIKGIGVQLNTKF